MKKVSFRLISLVLALALCLLPTMAGAVYLKPTWQKGTGKEGEPLELEFTVGEPAEEWIEVVAETGEELGDSRNVSDCHERGKEYDLYTSNYADGRIGVRGTPKKAGDFTGEIKMVVKIDGKELTKTFSIKFNIKEKETPIPPPPTVPTVVDNVIYNAAPEHEQALIRGVKEWCNVRAGAGTNSAVVGRANLGQQISLLRWNADESWCFVEFNGLQGWIAKQFILPIK